VSDSDLTNKQLRKLRRRIEDLLRHTTPFMLIKIANLCGVNVPKALREKYKKE